MTEISAQTVGELLQFGEDNHVALAAPGRPPLNYAGLRRQAGATAAALCALGIKRCNRVAIVLPSGPELASAFLCVAAAATTAPLNPAYRNSEFEFYLSDLKAKALIVEHDSSSPAVAVAKVQGLRVIEVKPTFPIYHPNSWKSYHFPTAKGTVSPMQPSDGMILVIGPRLEGHSVIFLAIQTHLSCRFLLAVDFPRPKPERVFVADHQSSSGFSGTGPSAPPPQPIGT